MKEYIKNNIFIFTLIVLVLVFFLVLSISEVVFFSKHLMQFIGTVIFLCTINSFNKAQVQKIKGLEEKTERPSNEGNEEISINKKNIDYKKRKAFVLKFWGSLLGIAIILTSIFLYTGNMEFSKRNFFRRNVVVFYD